MVRRHQVGIARESATYGNRPCEFRDTQVLEPLRADPGPVFLSKFMPPREMRPTTVGRVLCVAQASCFASIAPRTLRAMALASSTGTALPIHRAVAVMGYAASLGAKNS